MKLTPLTQSSQRWRLALLVGLAALMAGLVIAHVHGLNGPWYWTWTWRRLGLSIYPILLAASAPFFIGQWVYARHRTVARHQNRAGAGDALHADASDRGHLRSAAGLAPHRRHRAQLGEHQLLRRGQGSDRADGSRGVVSRLDRDLSAAHAQADASRRLQAAGTDFLLHPVHPHFWRGRDGGDGGGFDTRADRVRQRSRDLRPAPRFPAR